MEHEIKNTKKIISFTYNFSRIYKKNTSDILLIIHFKFKISLNYIEVFKSYRTVNTFPHVYNNQTLNVA